MFWNIFLAYSIIRNKRNWYLRLTNITVPQPHCSDLWNTTQFWPFSFTWKFSPGRRPVEIPSPTLLTITWPETRIQPNMNWEAKSKARWKKKRITWRNLLNYIIRNLRSIGRRVNFECASPKRAECNFGWGCIYCYECSLVVFEVWPTDWCHFMNYFFQVQDEYRI